MSRRSRNVVPAGVIVLLLCGCSTVYPDGTVMREPVGNAVCSFFIPGTGQMMNEEYDKGTAFLGGYLLTHLAAAYSDRAARSFWNTLAFVEGVLAAVDAYHVSKQYNIGIRAARERPRFTAVLLPAPDRAVLVLSRRF